MLRHLFISRTRRTFMIRMAPTTRRMIIGLSLITLLATSPACSERPTDEITAAEQAVADATSSELAPYIRGELTQLAGERLTLIRAVQTQDASQGLIRDYATPRQLAKQIQADTQRALVLGAQRRTAVQSEAAATVDEAQAALRQTHEQLGLVTSRSGRIGTAAAARELDTLDRLMGAAREAMAHHDYLSAVARARAVNAKAERLGAHIESVAIRAGERQGMRVATN